MTCLRERFFGACGATCNNASDCKLAHDAVCSPRPQLAILKRVRGGKDARVSARATTSKEKKYVAPGCSCFIQDQLRESETKRMESLLQSSWPLGHN